MMNDQTQIKIPWNGWRIVRRIGRGGFGTVYEIEREIFGKVEKAAMKVIPVPESTEKLDDLYSSGLDDEGLTTWCSNRVESIVNEYMVMNRLKGKTNIVSCDDIEVVPHGNDPGADIFIRMELLTSLNKLISIIQKREENLTGEEKETLRKLRPEHKEFTDEDVIRLGKDITQALEICEKNDIVHRDIKPENILISDDGDFKLGDFGTARKMEHTTAATFAGTERYMAPEVIKGGKTGKDVDTYALGLVMYRLLNRGRFPFYPLYGVPSAEEIENAQRRRLAGEPFDPPVDGSPELKALVMKACSYDRNDRFSSAAEMMEQIEEAEEILIERAANEIQEQANYDAAKSEPEGDEIIAAEQEPAGSEAETVAEEDAWDEDSDKTLGSQPIRNENVVKETAIEPATPAKTEESPINPDEEKTVSDSWSDADVTLAEPKTLSEEPEDFTVAGDRSELTMDRFTVGDYIKKEQQENRKATEVKGEKKAKKGIIIAIVLLLIIPIATLTFIILTGDRGVKYTWDGVSFSLPDDWIEMELPSVYDSSWKCWTPEKDSSGISLSIGSLKPNQSINYFEHATYKDYQTGGFEGLVNAMKYDIDEHYVYDLDVERCEEIKIDGITCFIFQYRLKVETNIMGDEDNEDATKTILWVPLNGGKTITELRLINDNNIDKEHSKERDDLVERIIKSVRIAD